MEGVSNPQTPLLDGWSIRVLWGRTCGKGDIVVAILGKSNLHACPPATIHITATSKYAPCSPEPLKSHPLGISFRARILSSDSVQLLVWLPLHLKVFEQKKRGTCSPHTHHTRVRQTWDNCCIPQLLLFRTVFTVLRGWLSIAPWIYGKIWWCWDVFQISVGYPTS